MGFNLPLQSLERANFTPDSDEEKAVRYVTNNERQENLTVQAIDQAELMCALDDIRQELQKLNMYWHLITNTKL